MFIYLEFSFSLIILFRNCIYLGVEFV